MHGYHNIHALAYENEDAEFDDTSSDYSKMFDCDSNDDLPLLVFHYGTSLTKVKDLLNARKIILKNDSFVEVSSLKL
jgi:hypothetical protein